MREILVDSGPLIALCDEQDRLHRRAMIELATLRAPLLVGFPVLTEAVHMLPDGWLRGRLRSFFDRGALRLDDPEDGSAMLTRCLSWLARFAEHAPDFTDAFLVNRAASNSGLAVWTFDREFRDVWRTAKGKPVRLAVK